MFILRLDINHTARSIVNANHSVMIGLSLGSWRNSSRLARILRSLARSSAALLKRKARASLSSDRPRSLKSVIVVRPPALPFLTALKNRTVSWCLPGNLGYLFDFLIRSSQPDRSRRSREVQRVPQPCCLKRERERHSSARART